MQIKDFENDKEFLFTSIFNKSDDLLFILEIQKKRTVIKYINKTVTKKLGYTLDEINKIGVEGFRKPLKNSKNFSQHIEELKKKKSLTDYATLIAKDKTEFPVEVNAKIIKKNNITYNVAIARDITHRINYEEELQNDIVKKTKELNQSLSILKGYQDAIDENSILTISDPNGIITYANDNFCKLSGYSRDEILGKPHSIVKHEDTPIKTFKDLWQTITNKKVWRGKIKNRNKNSQYYIVDVVIVPILDENSNIKEYLSIRHDITDATKKQSEIERLAHTDILTGIDNRLSLNKTLSTCKKEQVNLALIDINRFHEINDFYGETVGDKVIKALSNEIQNQLDSSYRLFHLQGDEFVILNIECSKETFIDKMIKLNNYLSSEVLIIDKETFYINTTVALSFEKPSMLLSTANLANRYAKLKGLFFAIYNHETSFENEYKSNIEWKYKIKKALDEDRFKIFFQPIVNTKTGEVFKYEALIRMIGEDGSIISPFFFLEKSKKSNQYIQITKIVIEESIKIVNSKNIRCNINITIEDIESSSIKELIFKNLQNCSRAENITFELVESEGIENFEEVNTFIQKIKSYGCSLAIDDFGTGYSNFEYLLKLNADSIKIDGSLIKDIDINQDKYDIVKTIVGFAKTKKLLVVAEFVSSEDIYKKIKALNIDFCQGYYFGEPKPLD